jgi:hypothetical protein
MRFINFSIFFLCAITVVACGKKCLREEHLSSQVQITSYQAAYDTQISFCIGGRYPEKSDRSFPSTTQAGVSATMKTHIEYKEDAAPRYDGSCNDNGRKDFQSETVPVALTTEGFATVKLC